MSTADYSVIVDQLVGYCDCVDVRHTDIDKHVEELVHLVSQMCCWADEPPCATFLLEERREVVPLPDSIDSAYEFEPFYHPFVKDSFVFKLVEQTGTEETLTEVTDYAYSEVDEVFRLNLPISNSKCACSDKTYKLLVTYDAGYESIPECLLPVFCNLLEVIKAKNTCHCESCNCENESSEDNVTYASGDVVTVALETDLGKILVENYKKELGMLSLCDAPEDIWGYVV